MLTQSLYQYIYLFGAGAILLYLLNAFYPVFNEEEKKERYNSALCIVTIIVLTIFIGNRPSSVGSDTVQYIGQYIYLKGHSFHFDTGSENLIFDNLFALCGSLNLDISIFFILIAAIYFSCIYIACRKLFPDNTEIAFFSYLVAFSTFSYGTDGIKAGAGAAIFLVALAYKDKTWLSILLALISVGMHHSMFVVVYAYIISVIYKNTEMYFYGWILATLIAVSHISVFQELFAGFADDKGKDYLLGSSFMTGFRPDFILYSAMPILVGYIMYFRRGIRSEKYELILRLYLTTNSVWMLCMYASYTNRIAYLSWFMYPIVLLYPYYEIYWHDSQFEEGSKVVKYHMWFTLFMYIVYYGIFQSHH